MGEPQVRISTEGGMWVRQLAFRDGDTHRGHYHSHDHVTLLAAGELTVAVEGETHRFTAPHIITIPAGKRHDLTAHGPTVAYCVAPIADVATYEAPR